MHKYLNQTIDDKLIEPISEAISDTIITETTHYFYLRLASFKLRKTIELLLATKLPKKHTYTAIIHKAKHRKTTF
ncbi:MAG: hypothetical protein ACOYO1_05265 [Bacteroidales bacterium]